ncbi:hypothetical protein ACIO02_37620 [Streptomyces sp. NPDC087568]|uniref:hypothetical protein n=1 Tax=Streptomyces sp. NPDC087568 TaxID=3365799 RepID=UPI003818D4F2
MPEIRDSERQHIPHVFEALRAVTVDAPGAFIPRNMLGAAICRWLGSNGHPYVPKSALNHIMSRAGYPKHRNHYRHISLRPGHWPTGNR